MRAGARTHRVGAPRRRALSSFLGRPSAGRSLGP
jgi:hypothetical protein